MSTNQCSCVFIDVFFVLMDRQVLLPLSFPYSDFIAIIQLPLLLGGPAPCCRPPRRTATVLQAPGMRRATQPGPSDTSTCGDCSTCGRWTSSLPCGRCFTCSRRHRGFTATSTTGSRPKTSGPAMTQPSSSCSASGFVVLPAKNLGQPANE